MSRILIDARGLLLAACLLPTFSCAHPYSIAERDNDTKATLDAITVLANASVLIVEPLDDRYIKAFSKYLNHHGQVILDVPAKPAAIFFTARPPNSPSGPKFIIDSPHRFLHSTPMVDLIVNQLKFHKV